MEFPFFALIKYNLMQLRFLLRNLTRFHHEHLVLVLKLKNTSWFVMGGVRKYRTTSTKLAQLPRPRRRASEEPCPCSPCRPQLLARRSRRSAMATSSSSVSHSSERASLPWLSSCTTATHRTEPELLVRAGQDHELFAPKLPELLPGQNLPQRHPSPSPSQQRAPAH
jgi:hypothetical protein